MVDPPDSLSGAATSRITIKAETDGQVLINGEWDRMPIHIEGPTSHVTVEGFNACCSSQFVVRAHGSDGTGVEFKRIVAWDSKDSNYMTYALKMPFTLCEDCAAFGIGRKHFTSRSSSNEPCNNPPTCLPVATTSGANGDYTTCRRCWGRWEGSHAYGPKMVWTLSYHNVGFTCENCFGTWDNGSVQPSFYLEYPRADGTDGGSGEPEILGPFSGCGNPQSNGDNSQPGIRHGDGVFSKDTTARTSDLNAAVYGSIAYMKGATSGSNNCYYWQWSGNRGFANAGGTARDDGIRFENVVSYLDPSNSNFDDTYGFQLFEGVSSPYDYFLVDATSITQSGNNIHSHWSVQDHETAPAVGGLGDSIYVGDGAHICNRYENRVETSTPLFPWPMQQRIRDATASVGPGTGHQHEIYKCNGQPGGCSYQMVTDEHAVADVMSDIEAMFGPVPPQCKGDDGGPSGNGDSVPPPEHVRIVPGPPADPS
jgi:hypothetical protein